MPSAKPSFSDEQLAYMDAVCEFKQSIVLDAVAGAGKTTTMVETVSRLIARYPTMSVLCCAFNKRIADELANRVDGAATCKTLHALGMNAIRRKMEGRSLKVEGGKMRNILYGLLDERGLRDEGDYPSDIFRLVGLAKNNGIVPNDDSPFTLHPDTTATWEHIIDHHNLDISLEDQELAIDIAREALVESITQARNGVIDFDDMLYLPVAWKMPFTRFGAVFVDEAQDISHIQRVMLERLVEEGGHLFAIGDPHQAIYGFRGAASDSLDLIQQIFHASRMGLTFSFRCPKAVVAEARKHVSHIQPAPSAPDGIVRRLNSFNATMFQTSDFVVCRNNAPLVDLAFRLYARDVPCVILGSDMGSKLTALLKRAKCREFKTVPTDVDAYSRAICARFYEQNRPERAEALMEQGEIIRVIWENLPPDSNLKALNAKIKALFADAKQRGMVTLSSIHKAKGLEAQRVHFLDFHLLPSKYAKQQWELEQETNLAYVGITRAQHMLTFINSADFERNVA